MDGVRTRYSAHIGYLFTDRPFRERIRAAADHGFSAIEYPAPYGVPAEEMAALLAEAGVTYTQFGLRSGDASRGEKGLGIFTDRAEEFRASVDEGLAYARRIGVTMLHAMSGVVPTDSRTTAHWTQYVENLAYAADAAAEEGMTILVEAMSPQAVPSYLVSTVDRAVEAIRATGRKNIRLLFDVFHTVSVGDDPLEKIRLYGPLIGHVHLADYPGRHEPGSAELNFPALYNAFFNAGYRGAYGCEYKPSGDTVEGLGWLSREIQRA